MFRDSSIPSAYNRLAEISDNYLVWVRESKLKSGTSYSAYYQYFTPSWCVLFTNDYKITTGTKYSFDYNYVSNGYGGSYIDSADYSFELDTLSVDSTQFSDSVFARADFLSLFVVEFLLCVLAYWVFHNMSRLFFKGGL